MRPPRMRKSLCVLALTGLLGAVAVGIADADPASATRTVTYRGHRFVIPASWSVIDLATQPDACVRFDQHALYLGNPSAGQSCPAGAIGHTEALLVQPAVTRKADTGTIDQRLDHQYLAAGTRVRVTASYGTDKSLVRKILSGAGLPTHLPPGGKSQPPAPELPATLPLGATDFTGKGFDACTAPSSSAMSDWRAESPYRAVGIYIGGAERACSQANLTASWVKAQAAAGWHFIPLYVGLQAHQITSATSNGTAAADDAIDHARNLGFGPGTPLYYDMEAYSSGYRSTALAFLSAWTTELHSQGYKSAVYSSSSSAVTDLVDARGSATVQPDVIFDGLWNGVANTADDALPSTVWSHHQRVHQYAGNVSETYAGTTINIDRDYLDVLLGTTASKGCDSSSSAVRPPRVRTCRAFSPARVWSPNPDGSASVGSSGRTATG
ncbi:DUF1906 domain-containing protein [Streptomyces sp. NBC_00344]|uniref:DUF1906 domain-containing protein n=1 Tax=Streptomyces sp. NBC_00344 TaxID=2975720 RepID=UPI002E22D51B